jgi:acyl-CoA synthetase (NDP forming)
VTVAPGGLLAEDLAAALRPEEGPVIAAPGFEESDALARALERRRFLRPVVHGVRGRPPLLGLDRLRTLVRNLLELARAGAPLGLVDFELNPVLLTPDGPVAVDALGRLGPPPSGADDVLPRPQERIRRLLAPRSIAVAGVSERMNPGRVILRNVLDAGFDPDRVTVVKPGVERLDGCRCVADVSDLPEPVDLLVLSLAAEAVPAVVERVVERDLAASIILVAGGMDGGGAGPSVGPTPAERVRTVLRSARAEGRPAPVVNGPNCLGVRAVPARYDTLFIPRSKLAVPEAPPAPVALLSQSGAFAVARMSRLAHLNPRYVISAGNQLDLTISDYLAALEADEEVRVAACYVEGFRPGDGEAFLRAAVRWTEAGRSVLLYRAGRTRAGARAAASHTASLAGDYTVTRELAALAGVQVADTLSEFQDRLTLLAAWADRPAPGRRLAVVSNAGFECVAMADRIGARELAELTPATRDALAALVRGARLEAVVPVTNPLDLTPIFDDDAFVAAVGLVLEDPHVDVALVGCVPLTPALRTLPEEWDRLGPAASVADGLVRLWKETTKPWAVVVDAGAAYEPMRARLRAAGVPVLDYADRELPPLD